MGKVGRARASLFAALERALRSSARAERARFTFYRARARLRARVRFCSKTQNHEQQTLKVNLVMALANTLQDVDIKQWVLTQ